MGLSGTRYGQAQHATRIEIEACPFICGDATPDCLVSNALAMIEKQGKQDAPNIPSHSYTSMVSAYELDEVSWYVPQNIQGKFM